MVSPFPAGHPTLSGVTFSTRTGLGAIVTRPFTLPGQTPPPTLTGPGEDVRGPHILSDGSTFHTNGPRAGGRGPQTPSEGNPSHTQSRQDRAFYFLQRDRSSQPQGPGRVDRDPMQPQVRHPPAAEVQDPVCSETALCTAGPKGPKRLFSFAISCASWE